MNIPKIGANVQPKPVETFVGKVMELKSLDDSILELVSWTGADGQYHEKWFDVEEIEEVTTPVVTGGK